MAIPTAARFPDTWTAPTQRQINPEAILLSRHALNWSQTRLANYVGVSRETISFWERGKFSPTGPNALILADWIESTKTLLNERQLRPNARFYQMMEARIPKE